MKKSRFSDRQIIAILKQGDSGIPVAQLCPEHGLSAVSYYKWCANDLNDEVYRRRATQYL
ncbi:Transposase [Pseudovibrio sp. Ad14]|nr:Transposase [Pseudovibrio sp. W74]KZL10276.1 Transposase [Pseudovibrio sp. Ad14]